MQERSKGNVNQGRMVINKSGIEYEDKIFEMRKELNWIIEWRIPIRRNSQKRKLKINIITKKTSKHSWIIL